MLLSLFFLEINGEVVIKVEPDDIQYEGMPDGGGDQFLCCDSVRDGENEGNCN